MPTEPVSMLREPPPATASIDAPETDATDRGSSPTVDLRLFLLMTTGFVGLGSLDGAGGPFWPDVIDAFGISKGLFGLAGGLGLAVAFPVMMFAAPIADRFDKRRLLACAFVCMGVAAAGIMVGSGVLVLALLLIVRGLGFSILDLGNNALAMDYERETGRHVMSPLHAGFSAGTLLGAAAAWGVVALGGGYRAVYGGLAVFMAVLTAASVWSMRWRVPRSIPHADDASPTLALQLLRRPGIRSLAAINGICFGAEVLVTQWVAIYLREERDVSSSLGAAAVVVYGAAMLVGRLGNGPLTELVTPRRAIATQGTLTLVGAAMIVAGGPAALAIAGVGVAGLGLAGQVPTALSLVGAAYPRMTGAASGAALLAGYVGFGAAPFLAGLIATVGSVRGVMAVVALAGLAVLLLARGLPTTSAPATALAPARGDGA